MGATDDSGGTMRWPVSGDETLSDASTRIRDAGPRTGVRDADPTDKRRHALARGVVRILDRAVESSVLDIALADDRAAAAPAPEDSTGGVPVMAEHRARARVVINGPGALARLLFPPSADAFAEGTCGATSTSTAMPWRRSTLAGRSTCGAWVPLSSGGWSAGARRSGVVRPGRRRSDETPGWPAPDTPGPGIWPRFASTTTSATNSSVSGSTVV